METNTSPIFCRVGIAPNAMPTEMIPVAPVSATQWIADGTALVDPPAKNLTDGHWDGTLGSLGGIFNNFDGEWSASR